MIFNVFRNNIIQKRNTLQSITLNDYSYISVYMQSIHSYFEKISLFFMYDY